MPIDVNSKELEMFESRYSIGNSVLIANLMPILGSPACPYDTVLINLGTVLRNVYAKDIQIDTLLRKTSNEYGDMLNDIIQVMNENESLVNPTILVYTGDYSTPIPELSRKNQTPSRILTEKAIRRLSNRPSLFPRERVGNVTVDHIVFRGNIPTARQLYRKTKALKNLKKIIMLSHIALDYHIFNEFKKSAILESYTGKTLSVDAHVLGKKVFKLETVPFTQTSHVLLGDSSLLKLILPHKEKKRLLETSISEGWAMSSVRMVERSMRKHNFIAPFSPI